MAIYLEDEERQLLIALLSKFPDTYWRQKKLLEKVQDDQEEHDLRKTCQHSFADFVGRKTECAKCGGMDEGMGFMWQSEELFSRDVAKKIKEELQLVGEEVKEE